MFNPVAVKLAVKVPSEKIGGSRALVGIFKSCGSTFLPHRAADHPPDHRQLSGVRDRSTKQGFDILFWHYSSVCKRRKVIPLGRTGVSGELAWWTHLDLNLGPLACERKVGAAARAVPRVCMGPRASKLTG